MGPSAAAIQRCLSVRTCKESLAQLGLSNNEIAINNFIHNNQLPLEIPLENAAFWRAGQTQFIRECIALVKTGQK